MTRTRLPRRHFVPSRNDDSGSHATTLMQAGRRCCMALKKYPMSFLAQGENPALSC
ncbi:MULTISPECIES: hypothetical protein [unclassified Rickettsia]|uniref:hypothetical protein n=1 Tax=unclassified Rickettsia TaxID=114295 RepID=UPI003133040B